MKLSEIPISARRKVFLAGQPKSAGKTTFALTAPGKKLHLLYDLGNPSLPPTVNPEEVWVRQYSASLLDPNLASDKWKRSPSVGEQIIKDIVAVRDAFTTNSPTILFSDREEIPLPDTIILDGLTEMPQIILDWILAVNKKTDADEFLGANGQPNHFKLWQKRLETMRSLLHMIIPLPTNIILIGWEVAEMIDNKPTGRVIPDIGGKLDNMIPGKVDAALRCYATFTDKPSYKIQLIPDGVRQWIGIRGSYGHPKEIDVTLPGDPKDKRTPWQKVFSF